MRPRVSYGVVFGMFAISAIAGCKGSDGIVGDTSAGIQFAVRAPWAIAGSVNARTQHATLTSSTLLTCDFGSCPEPANVFVSTAMIGDLLDDTKYSENAKLNSEAGITRLYERTGGQRMQTDPTAFITSDFYGYRTFGLMFDAQRMPHHFVADFFIRDRHMICIAVALKANALSKTESDTVAVLEALRANLVIDGKPFVD